MTAHAFRNKSRTGHWRGSESTHTASSPSTLKRRENGGGVYNIQDGAHSSGLNREKSSPLWVKILTDNYIHDGNYGPAYNSFGDKDRRTSMV